jgi:hypothetical protein
MVAGTGSPVARTEYCAAGPDPASVGFVLMVHVGGIPPAPRPPSSRAVSDVVEHPPPPRRATEHATKKMDPILDLIGRPPVSRARYPRFLRESEEAIPR